jgi:hypothetical protein
LNGDQDDASLIARLALAVASDYLLDKAIKQSLDCAPDFARRKQQARETQNGKTN